MKAINIGVVKAVIAKKLSTDFINEGYNGSKALAGEFINIIKESPILQLEFKIYDRFENKTISSDIAATRYIDNNLSLFEGYSQEDINTEHHKIKDFVDESVAYIDKEKYELYNAIESLISETLNKTNPDVDLIHESFTKVLGHIKKDKTIAEEKTIELPKDVDGEKLIEHALNKFEEKYNDLNESEIDFIKSVVMSKESERKFIFENLKNENITLLEETKKDGIEDKIHETINKINGMEYSKDSSIKDIISLRELNLNIS